MGVKEWIRSGSGIYSYCDVDCIHCTRTLGGVGPSRHLSGTEMEAEQVCRKAKRWLMNV